VLYLNAACREAPDGCGNIRHQQLETEMATGKTVLLVGLDPANVDYSAPEYASFPGLDAAKVLAALKADENRLNSLGYDTKICLTDSGETASAIVMDHLKQKHFDCVLVGAGVRKLDKHFLLFERLINVVHEHAPDARICFNTKPDDTADAVRRWL
jgi:hypothetical protein